ncbi:MAG: 2-amino-4-hydroxy-6-hydroxymethyldihydropteridine diphosphokinase [Deltaproteobacteria bacterium]|nr:2-amino-4-hydroxy-6-hydroxymethyldihydropteridine diphosphokinase [Deltaproteobacteria bacterium]
MHVQKVFIAIGSNLGHRAANCARAIELIGRLKDTEVVGKSSLYETEPWGVTGQPGFINAAVEVRTSLEPEELLRALKSIEAGMGRKETGRWGPRTIDLDIIFYGDMVVEKEGLTIPHPRLQERAFVLVPLNEIAPDFMHPVLKKTVSELTARTDTDGVRRF